MEVPALAAQKTRRAKRKVVFVDLPQLLNSREKPNFYELFLKLRDEFNEVKTFTEVPENEYAWRMLQVIVNAGAFPILCPGDPDPIIVEELRRATESKNIGEIGLLSGDNGFFEVLETIRKRRIRVKVILPFNNRSRLLMAIADETVLLEEYVRIYAVNTDELQPEITSSEMRIKLR